MGWMYSTFGAAALPDKKFLDEVVPDRPVFLQAYDGHSSWANSKALAWRESREKLPILLTARSFETTNGDATGALKEAAGDLIVARHAQTHAR